MTRTDLMARKDVLFTDFEGGEGILVDLDTKKYYQLNETAALVWKGLEQGKTIAEIVDNIVRNYEVAAAHATQSVEKLIDKFQAYKLVAPKEN